MIARLLAAWRKRQAAHRIADASLDARLRQPCPPPILPQLHQNCRCRVAPADPPSPAPVELRPRVWRPSDWVAHVWPPIPPPLPLREAWTRRPAPPCDPAWRAETTRRPGCAVYPPRRHPGWLDSGSDLVP
jgi:hypothetical protein